MQKEINKVLKKYGLSENEIRVYTNALKLDQTSPYELAKLTGIPRTTVYDVITDLSLKGLLELERSDGFTKQQTKIKAKNPSTLRKNLRNRFDDLQNLEVDLVSILPMLKSDYQQGNTNSNFQYLPGVEGAYDAYTAESVVGKNIETSVFTHLMPMDAFGTKNINEEVERETKMRKKTNTKVKELIPLNKWTKHILTYQTERFPEYLDVREYRYIENPIFEQHQRIAIAGEHIFITCTAEDEAWGLKIRSKSLSTSLMSIFNILWLQAHPVTSETLKKWGMNEYLKSERKKIT